MITLTDVVSPSIVSFQPHFTNRVYNQSDNFRSVRGKEVFTMRHKTFLMLFVLFFMALSGSIETFHAAESMVIKSPAFLQGAMIPARYTCDGVNVSPPLEWRGAPSKTKYYALINDDPDAPAGTWVHWVVFDIPAGLTKLTEAHALQGGIAGITKQGSNSSRKIGYSGPCPPWGTHRYFFKLYALDALTGLNPGATKSDLLKAMQGHILAESQLMGKYSRK
jgi:Raf kinase inhibitor-like YbhB/YbcL family protein